MLIKILIGSPLEKILLICAFAIYIWYYSQLAKAAAWIELPQVHVRHLLQWNHPGNMWDMGWKRRGTGEGSNLCTNLDLIVVHLQLIFYFVPQK
jgi:hypothetical protein